MGREAILETIKTDLEDADAATLQSVWEILVFQLSCCLRTLNLSFLILSLTIRFMLELSPE